MEAMEACSNTNVCAGLPAGLEGACHALSIATNPRDLDSFKSKYDPQVMGDLFESIEATTDLPQAKTLEDSAVELLTQQQD